ncbi:29658_t:CDS:1, partial [Gigaspora margarita]
KLHEIKDLKSDKAQKLYQASKNNYDTLKSLGVNDYTFLYKVLNELLKVKNDKVSSSAKYLCTLILCKDHGTLRKDTVKSKNLLFQVLNSGFHKAESELAL